VSDGWGLSHLSHCTFASLVDDVCCVCCGLGYRKVLKEGENVPKILEDSVVKRTRHWVLSMSHYFRSICASTSGARCGTLRSLYFSFTFVPRFLAIDEFYRSCQMALTSHKSPGLMVCTFSVFRLLFLCACVAERLTWWKCTDYLQFTVTFWAEMPNEDFAVEISRAAGDLYGSVPPWGNAEV
jgi:hypothetical protein